MGFWQIYFYSIIIFFVYAIVCIITIKYSDRSNIAPENKEATINTVLKNIGVLAILGPLGLVIFYLVMFFGILQEWCKRP